MKNRKYDKLNNHSVILHREYLYYYKSEIFYRSRFKGQRYENIQRNFYCILFYVVLKISQRDRQCKTIRRHFFLLSFSREMKQTTA